MTGWMFAVLGLIACSGGDGSGSEEADADTDGDTDADSDSDSDADSDADTDSDSDADTDADPYTAPDWDYDGPLPEGDVGLGREHPGDEGIGDDESVLYHDDFEDYGSWKELSENWNAGVYHNVAIVGDAYRGAQALEFTLYEGDGEVSNGVSMYLAEVQDILFLRYYSKFEDNFDIWGSCHNGSFISAGYYTDGHASPGIPSDGYNKFLVAYESWRGEESEPNPGYMNAYVYYPEQRTKWGDHFFPNGEIMPWTHILGDFGDDFVPRDQVIPELDQWIEYEVMVKANTEGERDGRIAFWMDGVLIADWGNLEFRYTDELRIDHVGIGFHSWFSPNDTRKWYDDVVIATEYIGPYFDP